MKNETNCCRHFTMESMNIRAVMLHRQSGRHTHTHMHTYTRTHAHTHIHTHTHICMHTHTHTHTHLTAEQFVKVESIILKDRIGPCILIVWEIWLQLACMLTRLMLGALSSSEDRDRGDSMLCLILFSMLTLIALSSLPGLHSTNLSRLLTARAFNMVAVKGFDARNSLSYTYSSTNFLLVLSCCVCPILLLCICSVSTTCRLSPCMVRPDGWVMGEMNGWMDEWKSRWVMWWVRCVRYIYSEDVRRLHTESRHFVSLVQILIIHNKRCVAE